MAETSNTANWPAPLEQKFIVTLIEETGKGNIRNGIIKKDCGQAVTDEFNKQVGKHYSVNQIRGKLKRLKIKYNLFSRLIGRTDMEWDSNTNTVKGSDAAWLDSLKLNSKYNDFRDKGPDQYGVLRQLFSTVAQTSSAQHSTDDVDEQDNNPKGKQLAGTDTSLGKKRKSVFITPKSRRTVDSTRSQDFSMARFTEILMSMDPDKDTKFKALKILKNDFEWRQALITFDQKTRWEWIEYLQTRGTSLP